MLACPHKGYHFYFNCIGQINKLLRRLKEELQSPDIARVHTNFEKIFGKYAVLRDDLEHIDERAIGRKRGEPIDPIGDWGNFLGGSFSFAGKEHVVNNQTTTKLKQIYVEIIDVLHKNYASKNQGFVLRANGAKSETKRILTSPSKKDRCYLSTRYYQIKPKNTRVLRITTKHLSRMCSLGHNRLFCAAN